VRSPLQPCTAQYIQGDQDVGRLFNVDFLNLCLVSSDCDKRLRLAVAKYELWDYCPRKQCSTSTRENSVLKLEYLQEIPNIYSVIEQAKGILEYILRNSKETSISMSGNVHAWRKISRGRLKLSTSYRLSSYRACVSRQSSGVFN
jgi:hypothetical protein